MDKYVQSLGRDLREAMSLAQAHGDKQQHKQADVYNRKVHSVNVGDRVSLANKGKRGRRKLVDRWGNTVYVVVAKNCGLITYQIRSPTGTVKMVHRNVIMPVNFLPLPDSEDAEGHSQGET